MNMLFSWEGINAEGYKIIGEENAANAETLLKILQHQGISVLFIKKQKKPLSAIIKISKRKIAEFTRQLAILSDANVDLLQSFSILIQQEQNKAFKPVIESLRKNIENGRGMSESLSQFPEHFDKIYCAIIQAGEQSGALPAMLLHLAHYQENMLELKAKITKAMFYPISLITAAIFITLGLLIYVVPQFKTIFNNFGSQLPWFTQTVISLSQLLQKYFFGILMLIGAGIVIYSRYLKNSSFCKNWNDQLKLSMPFLKNLIITSVFARWTRIMSTLLIAQLSLLESLKIASQTLANHILQTDMQKTIDQIIQGESFHQALSAQRYFPSQLIPFLAIGENAGRLTEMLQRMAQAEQSILDRQIDHLSKCLEPAAMLILAILVGSLIIAMYLPIFQLGAIL